MQSCLHSHVRTYHEEGISNAWKVHLPHLRQADSNATTGIAKQRKCRAREPEQQMTCLFQQSFETNVSVERSGIAGVCFRNVQLELHAVSPRSQESCVSWQITLGKVRASSPFRRLAPSSGQGE